jgi:hypothetical protein
VNIRSGDTCTGGQNACLAQLLLKAFGKPRASGQPARDCAFSAIPSSQVQIAPQVYTCLCQSSQTLNVHRDLRAFLPRIFLRWHADAVTKGDAQCATFLPAFAFLYPDSDCAPETALRDSIMAGRPFLTRSGARSSVLRIRGGFPQLCPVHRGPIAMSGFSGEVRLRSDYVVHRGFIDRDEWDGCSRRSRRPSCQAAIQSDSF